MDEQNVQNQRPANPARRKRSNAQVFKEVYLPVIIAGVAALFIIIFIVGSIVRKVQKNKLDKQASIAASESLAAEQARLAAEAQYLLEEATRLADGFDYIGAIELLDTFRGDASQYPELNEKRDECIRLQDTLVLWNDPNQVTNLSFQLLIADTARAFVPGNYSSTIYNSFITTTEFSAILQQLYDNNYILVRLEDFVATEKDADGTTVYVSKAMYLPEGKKPLMLTQTNVNYNLYLVDSDGDMVADKDGSGFASKLVLDGDKVLCEMVDANGETVTGAYDLIPILDDFIEKHPDFSYRGAKATLAITGYNGIFGYRTNTEAREKFGEVAYEQDAENIRKIAEALTNSGYTLACYTYSNIPYGSSSVSEIQADLSNWNAEVVPLLGAVDILVYAQKSDIFPGPGYSGDRYNLLKESGFNYFIGFCSSNSPWTEITNSYVRQGRIMVSGSALESSPSWFEGMFDAASVLDPARSS